MESHSSTSSPGTAWNAARASLPAESTREGSKCGWLLFNHKYLKTSICSVTFALRGLDINTYFQREVFACVWAVCVPVEGAWSSRQQMELKKGSGEKKKYSSRWRWGEMSSQPGHSVNDGVRSSHRCQNSGHCVCMWLFFFACMCVQAKSCDCVTRDWLMFCHVGAWLTVHLKVNTPRLRVSTSVHHVSSLESGRCRQVFPPPPTRQSCAILICWVLTFSVPVQATSRPGVSLLEATKVSVCLLFVWNVFCPFWRKLYSAFNVRFLFMFFCLSVNYL